MEIPKDQEFRVVVELVNGNKVISWSGYADNTTEALYRTIDSWEEFIATRIN